MMKKLKFPFLNISLIVFMLGGASAQQTFSLQDCIQTGLERNFSLQVVRNQETIATNNVTLGNAGYLPNLNLRGQQSGTLNNTDQDFIDGSSISRRDVHNTTSNANVSLGWTLFDGFRVQTTYERLGALREMGELSTRMSVENLVSRIAAEYFNFIQQQRLLDNLKYAVDLSRERVRIDEERFLIGSGSKLQLLQAQVFLNADSSRLSRQYEVVRASRIRLNELMAMDDMHMPLQVADTTIALKSLLIMENLREAAMRSNTSLLIASRNQTISELDRKLIASNAYPFVTLSSGYGVTFNTFGSGSMTQQQTLGMNYGVTVGITIFDGLNQRRRMNNATIEIENRQLIYQEVENGVMADLYTIYNAYLNNLRLLEMEEQNLNVANETLEIAIERYRLGALSGLELREAQKSLLEAEERLLTIQYQAKLAEISLLQIAGRVMEYL
jgi:outer membrane protein, adhesin transport system